LKQGQLFSLLPHLNMNRICVDYFITKSTHLENKTVKEWRSNHDTAVCADSCRKEKTTLRFEECKEYTTQSQDTMQLECFKFLIWTERKYCSSYIYVLYTQRMQKNWKKFMVNLFLPTPSIYLYMHSTDTDIIQTAKQMACTQITTGYEVSQEI
jgi:hypothetical protein